ncbi:Notch [Parasponia andersonii]|uniref:Notch n=1 Tax=Parasponia andersonii TaxID=3476 RepID=A0A2P5AFA3_PARAD|nr:Notch [Parasponia andersonii]
MATEPEPASASTTVSPEKRHRSIFEVPENFFDSCILLPSPHSFPPPSTTETSANSAPGTLDKAESQAEEEENRPQNAAVSSHRWTCNTCKAEFDSLKDQRSHFKSDIHRFNVKLSLAGKNTVKEDDFDELTTESFKDYDVSSISGSEDETEKELYPGKAFDENFKKKLFIRRRTGERVSVWKSLVMNESDDILFENDKAGCLDNGLKEKDVIERLKNVVCEPRDKTHFRIVLLASGGHFAGCVFDGNLVVAHKTFHRYVVRAKAGKKQSSKDASGRAAHSAGASLRRYNELALKKEIQELLAAWKPYFDASSCVFIYAPSNNHQLLFNGEKPYFSTQLCAVRNVPLTVRRPTFKEARRLYDQLTQVANEVDEKEIPSNTKSDSQFSEGTVDNGGLTSCKEVVVDNSGCRDHTEACPINQNPEEASISSENESEDIHSSTPLHEAVQSSNAQKVLELLEQGLDPCVKDDRGRTPYMLASEKEVRNTFRRFMALNLDKWDWHAAKVPSALTKEMEESQATKQAEKDAKRKARAKELKKLRKAKEKKAQAEAAASQNALKVAQDRGTSSSSVSGHTQPTSVSRISIEEEQKRAQAAEREKRAAAAERRIAAAAVNAQHENTRAPHRTTTATKATKLHEAQQTRKNSQSPEASVTLHTNLGDIKCEIFCDEVPKTAENFLALCGSGYYDGTVFHRNIKGFMIQGGDPIGTGKGGTSIWGKKFNDEIRESLKHNARGILAMANSGPNTNGSQFFITYAKQPHLNGLYTVFGKVIHGFEVLDLMEKTPTGPGDRPLAEIRLNRVTIHANPLAG